MRTVNNKFLAYIYVKCLLFLIKVDLYHITNVNYSHVIMYKRYLLLIGIIVVDMLINEMRRNDVAMHEASPYATTWGELYQTESNPAKMYDFDYVNKPGRVKEHQGMRDAISSIMPAFSDDLDSTWLSKDDFSELLYQTSRHESYNKFGEPRTTQRNEGPAKSWWQVEPETARDIVTAYDRDKDDNLTNPRASKQYWGPKMEEITGFSADSLYSMSDDDLGALMESNPAIGAGFAAAKYLKAHKARK